MHTFAIIMNTLPIVCTNVNFAEFLSTSIKAFTAELQKFSFDMA